MTFRQLIVGDLFRFPRYDDPWLGTDHEGDFWKKVNQSSYVNLKILSVRRVIDDPNRIVWKEKKAFV